MVHQKIYKLEQLSKFPKSLLLWESQKACGRFSFQKKLRKMLKRLRELLQIKWRRDKNPNEKPKQKTNNQKAKDRKKKQKQLKPADFHHKKSIIEEYIDSLEDYQKKGRALTILGDYFPLRLRSRFQSWINLNVKST